MHQWPRTLTVKIRRRVLTLTSKYLGGMLNMRSQNLLIVAGIVWCFAFFYTGLGTALCMAGVAFFVARGMSRQNIADMHQRLHATR